MCRLISIAFAVAALIVATGYADAATMAELRKIDYNHNGALDAGREFKAYLELEKLTGDLNSKQLAEVGILQADIALQGNIPLGRIAEEEEQQVSGCDSSQKFYLRNDKIDVSIYGAGIDESAAEGATLSFTDNSVDDSETAEVKPSRRSSSPSPAANALPAFP